MPQPLAYNEKHLILQTAAGNESAYKQLYNTYRNKLYTFAYKLTWSETLAQDAVQEVFYKIWKDRSQLVQVEQFNAYLYAMSRNWIISQMRRIAKEEAIREELSANTEKSIHITQKNIDYQETYNLLQQAIRKLPEQQQKVYRMSREEGLKNEEIARLLGIETSTVKKHLMRAKEALRQYLSGNLLTLGFWFLIK